MTKDERTTRRATQTRLIVKNLPKYLDEKRMKEHFASMGEVTDTRIVRLKEDSGSTKSRQFGFVGYRTEEDAAKAVKFFHRTFIDTYRISVELAKKVGDAEIPRPWSKHSAGSSAYEKRGQATAGDAKSDLVPGKQNKERGNRNVVNGSNLEEDPEFQEFMEVMRPRSSSRLWANDDTAPGRENVGQRMPRPKKGGRGIQREITLVESKAPGGSGMFLKRTHQRFTADEAIEEQGDSSDEEYQDVRESYDEDEEIPEENLDEIDQDVLDDGVSDLDYLRTRMKKTIGDEDSFPNTSESHPNVTRSSESEDVDNSSKSEIELSEEEPDDEAPACDAEVQQKDHGDDGLSEEELEPERLFVKNIPYTATESELADAFSEFGQLETVHIVQDKMSKRSKGIAYISFVMPEDSRRAKSEMDGSIFQGRIIHVQFALAPPQSKSSTDKQNQNTSSYKSAKDAEQKARADSNFVAWNSLFIRQDTAASVAAAEQGISKSELLDPTAGDLPVRQALAETAVIADTKRHLLLAGVNVASLEKFAASAGSAGGKRVGRSTTTLLVKNLPFSASEEDILPLLNRHGGVARLVIPPTRALAVVEYLEPSEARAAFKGLSYKRFKDAPLYLEWAPEDVFSSPPPVEVRKGEEVVHTPGGAAAAEAAARRDAEILDSEEGTATVFVKNIMFGTTDEALKRHFATAQGGNSLRTACIARRQGKNGKMLSQGYGFLEYSTEDGACVAVRTMQGTVLDGHKLELQLSTKKKGDHVLTQKRGPSLSSPKIIIRNLAFEANKKELHQLLSPFGMVKSIRLPKKFDGSHRGFAFVEYATKQEASSAMDALGRSHFYGRHLVIERAKDEESLEDVRKRTARQFEAGAAVPLSKKQRFFEHL